MPGDGVDKARLDDSGVLTATDPMLRRLAAAATQVRATQLAAAETGLTRLADEGRPRGIVVAGAGAAALPGEVLAAVAGPGCPAPIVTVRGHQLPGWVGAADLVIALSGASPGAKSGTGCRLRDAEETLGVVAEAARRGCRLLCVAASRSRLGEYAVQAGGMFVPVPVDGPPRTALWALTVPVLLAARALRLAEVPDAAFEAAARQLEEISHRCRPASESFVNPAKQLALDVAGGLPMVWGTSRLAAVAARRFVDQCAENAKQPAVFGELPDVVYDQIAALEAGGQQLRLVVARDTVEHPRVAARCAAALDVARSHGVPVAEITAEGDHPLEKIATLLATVDYVTVYLAIALGFDPTPALSSHEIEARTSEG